MTNDSDETNSESSVTPISAQNCQFSDDSISITDLIPTLSHPQYDRVGPLPLDSIWTRRTEQSHRSQLIPTYLPEARADGREGYAEVGDTVPAGEGDEQEAPGSQKYNTGHLDDRTAADICT